MWVVYSLMIFFEGQYMCFYNKLGSCINERKWFAEVWENRIRQVYNLINQQVSYRPFCWLPFLLGLIVTTTQGSKQIKMRGVSVRRHNGMKLFIGKSLSEALILASINPQYDDRLFVELHVQYMKIPSSEHRENMLCT